MSIWDWLMNPSGLTPHGFCLSWAPGLIATHVIADVLIGLAYFSIPLAIASLLRRRPDIRYSWVAYLFVGFILACGATHLWAIVTLWYPAYGVEAVIKALTAVLSLATAGLLWPLLPKIAALPSTDQLERLNGELAAKVAEQDRTSALLRESEARVRDANHDLEQRVADRTAELERVNAQLTEALDARTRALAQRDLLLREVYHRVKNNLQIVDGMLMMQTRRLVDPVAREALTAMRGRLYALGLVHHQLMESHDLETFDIAPFLKELSENVMQSGPSTEIGLSVRAEPLTVGLDFAIPLGLIVTELVTNSLKHAFPTGVGQVEVVLERTPGGDVLLVVSDNGRGFNPESQVSGGSLGSTIVEGLVKQLGGTLTVKHENGVRSEISVPGPAAA
jgi:two-component sensor histidine kinase